MSDRVRFGLVVVVLCLAAFVGPTEPPQAHAALVAWLRTDAGLAHDTVGCVVAELRAGLLGDVPDDRLTTEHLRKRGLAAIPMQYRQIAGDVVIACSVDPDGRTR